MRQRGILRIHFTTGDLVRTHLVDVPDPMWETVLSLHVLQGRAGQAAFGEWRQRVRRDLFRRGEAGTVRERLFSVVPRAGYFPDFLTPPEGLLGLEAGIEAMCGVPSRRLAAELERLGGENDPSSWRRALAEPGTRTRSELGESFRAYHQAALRPYWADVQSRVHADRALRSRLLREEGVAALFSSFAPYMRWRAPVLEADYPVDKELRLDGRGLLLIPSYFCWRQPVTLADPELPPTLVYPVEHDAQGLASPGRGEEALARLLGPTRAAVLRATIVGPTTGELADRVGISPAGASQHTTTLREAGLIASRRQANRTIHVLTPLGWALLTGDLGHSLPAAAGLSPR
ncbi:winged helix-turn-helix domain-containing protein [Actinoallomurus vinaceus]|uniref:Winged helix-turn-helix domain-containing protein n=1 Tax=Actinoallomurus vinaceus TaxID=1080074 RepID=A0ABP8UA92_9ACTN